MTTQSTASEATGRRPSHRLWLVQGEGESATWTELAALWPTKRGSGLGATIDAELPLVGGKLTGRLVILPAKFKAEGQAQEAAQ